MSRFRLAISNFYSSSTNKTSINGFEKKGIRQRPITEITSENVAFCKELTKFTDEIQHLYGHQR